ncbi:MAG TPA: methyltransferase domain-containing protein [Solirubrobacteraceae bacterium]|nr:methyltransferase domain-containing protein [Solirubrobacteraceae bacterium]
MSETRTWNGRAYDRISTPMEQLGREVIERLELRGDETVLDAGCGSGRLTQVLVERVPRGRVIGVDASASMIDAARERLGDGADLRVADLVGLDLGRERVDVVFSTATFHWIADHAALFASLRANLREGGRLVAQCGGAGNVESVHRAAEAAGALEPFAAHFAGWVGPWNFAAPQDTERRLRAAGFGAVRCWLAERPVTPDDAREFLRTIVLGAHLDQLHEALHDAYLDAVLDRLGPRPTIDYVRLNIDAAAV